MLHVSFPEGLAEACVKQHGRATPVGSRLWQITIELRRHIMHTNRSPDLNRSPLRLRQQCSGPQSVTESAFGTAIEAVPNALVWI
jgi:hypothetical protein